MEEEAKEAKETKETGGMEDGLRKMENRRNGRMEDI